MTTKWDSCYLSYLVLTWLWKTYGKYQGKTLSAGMGNVWSDLNWGGPQLQLLWPVSTFILSNNKIKKIINYVRPNKGVWKAYLNKDSQECSILLHHLSCTDMYHESHFALPFVIFLMVLYFLQQNYKAAFSRKYLSMELDHRAEENNHIIWCKNI